jgi:hypothetical protein
VRRKKIFEKAEKMGLSHAETLAMILYSANLFKDFVKYLSSEKNVTYTGGSDKDVEAVFLAAISAVNKLPKHKSTVYFGSCLPLDIFLPLLKPGEIFSQRNFTSTSKDMDIAESFSQCFQDKSGEMIFTIEESHSGADISSISSHFREEEVVFLPSHPFRVKSINKRPQMRPDQPVGYLIVLEELK